MTLLRPCCPPQAGAPLAPLRPYLAPALDWLDANPQGSAMVVGVVPLLLLALLMLARSGKGRGRVSGVGCGRWPVGWVWLGWAACSRLVCVSVALNGIWAVAWVWMPDTARACPLLHQPCAVRPS